jgi:hypothetical protein
MEKGALGTCFEMGQTTSRNTTTVRRQPGDDQRLIRAWLTAGLMLEDMELIQTAEGESSGSGVKATGTKVRADVSTALCLRLYRNCCKIRVVDRPGRHERGFPGRRRSHVKPKMR